MNSHSSPAEVVLFIHGFGRSPASWKAMLDFLRKDEQVTSRYELVAWSYPTKGIESNPLDRIARLSELSQALAGDLQSPQYADRRVTLVGHTMGGLVILRYLANATHGVGTNYATSDRQYSS